MLKRKFPFQWLVVVGALFAGKGTLGADVPNVDGIKELAGLDDSVAVSYLAAREALIKTKHELVEGSEHVVTGKKIPNGVFFQVKAKFVGNAEELRLTVDGVAYTQAAYASLDKLTLERKPVPVSNE